MFPLLGKRFSLKVLLLQTINLQKEFPHQAVVKLVSNGLFRISGYAVVEIIWCEGGVLLRCLGSA